MGELISIFIDRQRLEFESSRQNILQAYSESKGHRWIDCEDNYVKKIYGHRRAGKTTRLVLQLLMDILDSKTEEDSFVFLAKSTEPRSIMDYVVRIIDEVNNISMLNHNKSLFDLRRVNAYGRLTGYTLNERKLYFTHKANGITANHVYIDEYDSKKREGMQYHLQLINHVPTVKLRTVEAMERYHRARERERDILLSPEYSYSSDPIGDAITAAGRAMARSTEARIFESFNVGADGVAGIMPAIGPPRVLLTSNEVRGQGLPNNRETAEELRALFNLAGEY